MGQEDFDELLARIPGIADAVNEFESEAVQAEAFRALLDVWEGSDRARSKPKSSTQDKGADTAAKDGGEKGKNKGGQGGKGGGRKTPPVSAVKNLDLRPKDKQSFADFVASKRPSTNLERCLTAAYYLSDILGLGDVGADHVYTCFKDHKAWRIPSDLRNTLAQTSSRKNWLDTSDMEAIGLTPQGRNVVEHDLPRNEKK